MSVVSRNRPWVTTVLRTYKCTTTRMWRYPSYSSLRTMSALTIPLNDGSQIPWLAFGTGTALYSKNATKSVLAAIKAGFVHFDGAQMYGNEETLGDAIVQSGVPRSSLWVTTKLAAVPPGKDVRYTLKDSLKKLKTDYVDLFLIHNPKQHADIKSVWKQMEDIKNEGLAKSIGVSNFTAQHLKQVLEVATIKPAVIQVSIFSPISIGELG